MKKILQRFTNKFFGERLEFRAKIFNIVMFIVSGALAIGGVTSMRAAKGESIAGIPALVCATLVLYLIWYANKSGKYQRCYWIVTIVIFMIQTAIAFFLNGGYQNGLMFTLFIINAATAAFLFEGKKAIVIPLILIAEYAALCVFAYFHPNTIRHFGEREQFLSAVSIFVVTCASFCAIIVLHMRIHDRQKRELEEARKAAEEARRVAVEYEKNKSDLFTAMSHEFRTPLSVIATSAKMANKHIDTNSVTNKTRDYLESIYQEANRLAGLTALLLKSLRTPLEPTRGQNSGDNILKYKYFFEPVHIDDFAKVMTGMVKPVIAQNGFSIAVQVEDDVPQISGDRDALIQLMLNLLQNIVNHSGGKNVVIRVSQKDGDAVLTVEDDGAGIPQELLPNVCDRGVSGANSTGLGLYICKGIVNAHKGKLIIENKSGGGTRVSVMFPILKGDK